MTDLRSVSDLKSRSGGERVTFRARVLRSWEVGGLRMCLVGDDSALVRAELGRAIVLEGESYEFQGATVHEYSGGWRSVTMTAESSVLPLDYDIAVSQDEGYIERTYKILSGVQRKKGRAARRLPAWRHPGKRE